MTSLFFIVEFGLGVERCMLPTAVNFPFIVCMQFSLPLSAVAVKFVGKNNKVHNVANGDRAKT